MILQELIKLKLKALKPRDPNQKVMADKAISGAAGKHKKSKQDLELRNEKHKKKFLEALNNYDSSFD